MERGRDGQGHPGRRQMVLADPDTDSKTHEWAPPPRGLGGEPEDSDAGANRIIKAWRSVRLREPARVPVPCFSALVCSPAPTAAAAAARAQMPGCMPRAWLVAVAWDDLTPRAWTISFLIGWSWMTRRHANLTCLSLSVAVGPAKATHHPSPAVTSATGETKTTVCFF
jgi:hypothetical protein